MNCFEFRRQCLAEPRTIDEQLRAHFHECRACRAYATELQRFDQDLQRALQIDVPGNLRSRILLRQSLRSGVWTRVTPYLAMAASLFLAVMVALWLPDTDPPEGQSQGQRSATEIEALVLNYLDENHENVRTGSSIDTEHLNGMLRPLGMELAMKPGPVQAARPCIIRGNQAAHLVMPGEHGTVDILFMPHEFVGQRLDIINDNKRLLIFPCPRGSIAIVGHPQEMLATVERRLHEVSAWL